MASPHPSTSRLIPPSTSLPTISHDFTKELSIYLETIFVPAVKPTSAEYAAKEGVRQFLESLTQRIGIAKLLPFGSMANGFALKNSDMDLCCFLGEQGKKRSAAELVELLGNLIQQETNFDVKMLPRARIPIIKLTIPPSTLIPSGMLCDIGFENRLALENTRLLLNYALVDTRLRTLVLFLKVWTKRRKINNPYRGTLSSYGYVLLVIYFLAHVKGPPILPNLQRMPSTRPIPPEELEFEGHDISFFDDLESLSAYFKTENFDNSGQLLIEFFNFFAEDFPYDDQVISIRSEGGQLSKLSKGWPTESTEPEYMIRDQHKLCIEDPFHLDYNVARTVTADGLYAIRGEFIRAHRILVANSTERVSNVVNEVCEDREEFVTTAPHLPVHYNTATASPRRRSAPSPRMNPQQPPPTNSMTDFRIWAAANGVGGTAGLSNGGGYNGITPGGELNWDSPNLPFKQSPLLSAKSTMGNGCPRDLSRSSSPAQTPTLANHPIETSTPPVERRVSWDGGHTPTSHPQPLPTTSTNPTGAYDIHRFFQNQPNDPEIPTYQEPQYMNGPGRSPYRPSPFIDPRSFHRPSTSLPPPRPNYSQIYSQQPSPIFPVEDRETIIQANSITFGNFKSDEPLRFAYTPESVGSSRNVTFFGGSPSMQHRNGFIGNGIDQFELEDEEFDYDIRGRNGFLGVNDVTVTSSTSLTSINGVGKRRGRSVPLVRLGSDGREIVMLKFGQVDTEFFLPSRDDSLSKTTTTNNRIERNGFDSTKMEIPTFSTIPPTPLKSTAALPPLSPTLIPTPPSPIIPISFSTPIQNKSKSNSNSPSWTNTKSPIIGEGTKLVGIIEGLSLDD